MQHLDMEALARLVDEPAEPAEAEHLRGCLVCRRELAGMRAQTEALGELGTMEPPAGAWAALEARLLDEKLIGQPARVRPLLIHRPHLRIAASLALFLLGGAAGALFWRTPGAQPVQSLQAVAAEAPRSTSRPVSLMSAPEVTYVTEPAAPAADANGARLAVNGAAERSAPRVVAPRRTAPRRATAAEADRAARELMQAQAAYMGALQRLAAIADPASGNAPETRMAALDRLVQLTAEALDRVPGDPVINGYHLAAVAERDALRREMEKDANATWF
ncbi:MAG TPA: hypothetical protein VGC13_12990 [Longimicrobium sp.]|uniref:hypothetical protein n=1 Tax=Longimicrobium sp. TaxID=2029185 RepID=UPI002EDB7BC7